MNRNQNENEDGNDKEINKERICDLEYLLDEQMTPQKLQDQVESIPSSQDQIQTNPLNKKRMRVYPEELPEEKPKQKNEEELDAED